jgi:Uncharacterised nucleotidyltransferase
VIPVARVLRRLADLSRPLDEEEARVTAETAAALGPRWMPWLEAHRLAGVAAFQGDRARIPWNAEARGALLQHRLRSQARHTRHRRDLSLLLDHLKRHGVPGVPFKGADLSERLYPDPVMRPSADLDVLVPGNQAAAAGVAAREAGFVPPHGRPADATLEKYHFHSTFTHPASGTFLEIHWRLADAAALPVYAPEEAWFQAGRLPDDVHLLYLCVHLAKHGWLNRWLAARPEAIDLLAHPVCDARLIWFTDLILLKPQVPAARLAELARAWRVESALGEADALLRAATGVSLVDDGAVRPTPPNRRERLAARWIVPRLRAELDTGTLPATLPWYVRPHPVWHVRPVRALRGA